VTTYWGLQLIADNGVAHTVASFPAVVGKSHESDVKIEGNPTISRAHARLLHADNLFAVEDLGSTNCTYVQGCIARPGRPLILSEGDEVRFSDERFHVHLVAYDTNTTTLMKRQRWKI